MRKLLSRKKMSEETIFFIGNQIQELITINKLNQSRIAEATGVTKGFISKLVKNKSMASLAFIISLCNCYGCNVEYFKTGKGQMFPPENIMPIDATPPRKIPVINKAQCGSWVDFTDLDYPAGVADRYEYAPTRDLNAFYVVASGDSMIGSGIAEGDLLLIEPTMDVINGSIVLANGTRRFTQCG